jgi:hypothetical protein
LKSCSCLVAPWVPVSYSIFLDLFVLVWPPPAQLCKDYYEALPSPRELRGIVERSMILNQCALGDSSDETRSPHLQLRGEAGEAFAQ